MCALGHCMLRSVPSNGWTETRWRPETPDSGYLTGGTDKLAFYSSLLLPLFTFPLLGVVQAAPESLLCLKKLPLGCWEMALPRPHDDWFLPVLSDLLLAL